MYFYTQIGRSRFAVCIDVYLCLPFVVILLNCPIVLCLSILILPYYAELD